MKDCFNQDLEIGDFVVVCCHGTAYDPLVQRAGKVTEVFEDTCKVVMVNAAFMKLMPETSVSMQSRIVKVAFSLLPDKFISLLVVEGD